jgi:hypothetical protein
MEVGGAGRGLEWLKNFDVFPKTVDDAKEVSVSGGSVYLDRERERERRYREGEGEGGGREGGRD